MFFSLLLGIILLLGLLILGLAMVARHNSRPRTAVVFALVGLALTVWSGQLLHERHFSSEIDKKIAGTEERRDAVVRQQRVLERKLKELTKQRDGLVAELQDAAKSALPLENQMEREPELKQRVEQIAVLNRWLADCEKATEYLTQMERDLETTLFYLRNTAIMSGIEDVGIEDAGVRAALEHLKASAETPTGGSVPIPVTESEMKEITRLLQND